MMIDVLRFSRHRDFKVYSIWSEMPQKKSVVGFFGKSLDARKGKKQRIINGHKTVFLPKHQ